MKFFPQKGGGLEISNQMTDQSTIHTSRPINASHLHYCHGVNATPFSIKEEFSS